MLDRTCNVPLQQRSVIRCVAGITVNRSGDPIPCSETGVSRRLADSVETLKGKAAARGFERVSSRSCGVRVMYRGRGGGGRSTAEIVIEGAGTHALNRGGVIRQRD
ncbi:hypothetical protein [Burkholderia stabilis]|uniref:hypothetical protein n=1 Tax=Burkholderia stabilis TaxID=95485 RepID=UPI0012EA9560|nr:hypothetical protein [Burkholderia stabilis]HDR9494305.1 hypothetical protein [Burkholderia stabilis]HDR9541273.1 hypothetical protein [Burkholderia stabilis]HDR9570877.1 hypothetical protein [Burkholderia stabilis]HDR9579155.1 hypothetical protein [Burkholderia stabilis]HDR9625953.1 hypothetical protein [Burkholderia stabilis]